MKVAFRASLVVNEGDSIRERALARVCLLISVGVLQKPAVMRQERAMMGVSYCIPGTAEESVSTKVKRRLSDA